MRLANLSVFSCGTSPNFFSTAGSSVYSLRFRSHFLSELPPVSSNKIALLLTTEFEGLGKNGGVGTYYKELCAKLFEAEWQVVVVMIGGFLEIKSADCPYGARTLVDLTDIESVVELQPIHRRMRASLREDPNQLTGLDCFFILQAFDTYYKSSQIYAEFHEMFGFGFLSAKARRAGLLGSNISIAVTMHSGHEWIYDANNALLDQSSREFQRIASREQQSFADACLSMYPSDSLYGFVRGYGWPTKNAIKLPYFIPLHQVSHGKQPVSPTNHTEVIFFGRLEERKGLVEFLDAICELPESTLSDIKVSFLGKSIQLFSSELGRLTSSNYIAKRLGRIVSYRIHSDLSSFEAIAYVKSSPRAVVCLASHSDNFPNAALEVGQIPVNLVVSDTTGFRQTLALVERQAAISWFQAGSSDSLKIQLQKAIGTPAPDESQVISQGRVLEINADLLRQRLQLIEDSFANIVPLCDQALLLGIVYDANANASHTFKQAIEKARERNIPYVVSSLSHQNATDVNMCELRFAAVNARADIAIANVETLDPSPCLDAVNLVDILAMDYRASSIVLVRIDIFNDLPFPVAFNASQLHRQLVAMACVVGSKIGLLPYPLARVGIQDDLSPPPRNQLARYQTELATFLAGMPKQALSSRALFQLILTNQQNESASFRYMPDGKIRNIVSKSAYFYRQYARSLLRRYRLKLKTFIKD